jgi:hypothetical protein
MIAQSLLSIGLLAVAFYGITQRSRSHIIMYIMLSLCILGEVFVLFPSLSNRLAHIVGIGRGADLIMYCFIVASLGLALSINLRLRSLQEEITQVARAIALSNALPPEETPSSKVP